MKFSKQVNATIEHSDGGFYMLYLSNRWGFVSSIMITEPEALQLCRDLDISICPKKDPETKEPTE